MYASDFINTALGNCHGSKLPKCWLQFTKQIYCVNYDNFRHTFVPYSTVTWVTFGYRLVVFVWRSCCSRRLRSRLCTGSSSCAESSRTPRSRSSRLCSLRTLPSPQLQRSAYDTHTRPFNGPSSGTTRVSRYQKRKANLWTLLKQETVSGSGIRWAICKSAPRCRQTTTTAPHHAVFYGCPSCRPTKVR